MTLSEQIASLKFDFVNSDINEANFPSQPTGTAYELYVPNTKLTIQEVEQYAASKQMEVANLYDLLAYTKDGWNNTDWVVALGSSAEVRGYRVVPSLGRYGAERNLYLCWYGDDDWRDGCRFLLVRKSEGTGTLEPSGVGTAVGLLEFRRKELALVAIKEGMKWARDEVTLENAVKAIEQELINAGL